MILEIRLDTVDNGVQTVNVEVDVAGLTYDERTVALDNALKLQPAHTSYEILGEVI